MMVLRPIQSACGKGSDEPACTHDLARAFASRINIGTRGESTKYRAQCKQIKPKYLANDPYTNTNN